MKLGRHKGVEVVCEICNKKFIALEVRVKKGWGRFCSRKCGNNWQRIERKSSKHGKENAKTYPNKSNEGFYVQWYNDEGRAVNSPWHKWAWEISYGEIPDGYAVEYKDGDKNNIILENLQLRLTRQGKKLLPKQPRKEMSLEHRNKISQTLVENWRKGVFDVHRGHSHRNFKENKVRHPKEFNEELKQFIRERDNHTCQICSKNLLGQKEPVHHIDGVKSNNHSDNLILVCDSCHATIHFAKNSTDPVIMAFRSKLLE